MLQPNRTKYRKDQKGRNYGLAQRGANVSFGDFGLKVIERGRLTARQIEAARRALTRHIKRGGKVWIRVFPDNPVTAKPLETRQGSGKGPPKSVWVTVRVTLNTGLRWSSRAACSMKWTALTRTLPARPLPLLPQSFL